MLDHRVVGGILFLLLLVVYISFVAGDTSCNAGDSGNFIVQFRGASCTANTLNSCVGDQYFGGGEALPIGLFEGSQPGTRAPVIEYGNADPEFYYTVLMIDPDAPNPSNPTSAPWLHWMVVNIHGQNLLSDYFEGDTKKVYAPPTPPSGIHRYTFLLLEQPGYLKRVHTPSSRARFDVEAFAQYYRLKSVAQTCFMTGQEVRDYRNQDGSESTFEEVL